MPKRSRSPHRPIETKPHVSTPQALLRGIPEAIARNIEGLLVALAILHILLFLVFLGSIAISKVGNAPAQPFGAPTAGQMPVPPPPPEAITKPGAVALAAFTIFLWSLLLVKRRRISPRIWRFVILMLTPGTLMAAYALFRVFHS